ncbi:hypothetical protein AQ711_02565 [Burkholderia pseudomallei]|nr:hypothetical protein AQ711_02565 [Burkholderia pseudomallei]
MLDAPRLSFRLDIILHKHRFQAASIGPCFRARFVAEHLEFTFGEEGIDVGTFAVPEAEFDGFGQNTGHHAPSQSSFGAGAALASASS